MGYIAALMMVVYCTEDWDVPTGSLIHRSSMTLKMYVQDRVSHML